MADDRTLAAALVGRPIDTLVGLSGGGNNRLFRVVAGDACGVMKRYDAGDASGRERFARETAAAQFLANTVLADRAPRLVAADEAASAALFDWIAGAPVETRGPDELAQLANFIRDLHAARTLPGAQAIGAAAEACLSPAELARQIDGRRGRLGAVADEPGLSAYLARFDRAWRPLRQNLADDHAVLAQEHQTLSPSDFGFHNARRRPDARLVFLDFEYFGWDDPAKLTADILWHPGMMLREDEAAGLQRTFEALYGRTDPGFARRLARVLPAFGLRWCLILLNEFLPDRWARRRQARDWDAAEWGAAKLRQMAKAEHLIARVEACRGEIVQ